MKPKRNTKKAERGPSRHCNVKKIAWSLAFVSALLCLSRHAKAVPIGNFSVGQKAGDVSLGFGIDYTMRRVTSSNSGAADADMSSKGFSMVARYNIVSSLGIFVYGGFSDIWLSNPDFRGYLGGSYGGGVRLSLPDPHRSRFTINFDADVGNTQSGNGTRGTSDFEYRGAVYAAFKNANTITYGGLEGSNVDLSFTSPNVDYISRYNIGGVFGLDQFITPYVFFNFEVHVFDEQSLEGSIGYTFF
ncbi:MAG: hypothetical protein M1491_03370 [Deltaproteobacteria bacterium]|nr:hypothetical protein [Deltaproteobacteria bacterium]MCL5278026.1 hypothetical protein [Deltaproteobacteria bacterium]